MAPAIPVGIFQKDDLTGAGEHVYENRARGVIAAAFVLSDGKSDGGDQYGTLFVGMPESHGITLAGHNSTKARFHIQVFRQGEQIALWMKETDIQEACDLLSLTILPFERA